MPTPSNALLHTGAAIHPLVIDVADRFRTRLRGLMLAPPLHAAHALLLTRCSGVHTAFMRQTIDLLYLDAAGTVLRCVENVRPWRCSAAWRATHVLEMAGGSIGRLGLAPGDRLAHPVLEAAAPARPPRQAGASMTEFIIVAPVLLLIGLALLQYSLLFVAKNQVNHAAFMAVRAGSMHNATAESISAAYLRHLAPLYGGGGTAEEVAAAVARATADMQGNYRLELINPARASFDDFSEPELKQKLGTDARVIPNAGLAMRDPGAVRTHSGQNIFDANLLKVRITHGYQPGVALVARVFSGGLLAADDGSDAFVSDLLARGRVPVSADITLHMNSEPIEWADPVWLSAKGEDGRQEGRPASPAGAQDPPAPRPPDGQGAGREADPPPAGIEPDAEPNADGGKSGQTGGDSATACGGQPCPVCKAEAPDSEAVPLSSDILFDFDQATLKPDGTGELDSLIDDVIEAQEDGQAVASISITGHTDQLGSDAVNRKLSLARAEAVRDYLKAHGFPDVPVTVRGMGAAQPRVPLADCGGGAQEQQDCLAPNRRVVIDIRRAGQA